MNRILHIPLLALLLLSACAGCRRRGHTVTAGFYYWKTTYAPDAATSKAFQDFGARKIYLRCFDADWDEAAAAIRPVAVVRLPAALDKRYEYVPVIFITQKAISALALKDITGLSAHLTQLLESLCSSSGMAPKEIQVDCDWTAGSKTVYFDLLQALKRQPFFKDRNLSCTIRLHQVKYKLRSGIPPADRGMLMLYNIGNLKQATARNSILDVPLAKDYLASLDAYPLKLDIALPLFSWCVLFRNGVYGGIIRDADPAELQPPLFAAKKGHQFTVTQDTLWHGYGLRTGDVLRAESPVAADLKALAAFSAAHLKTDSTTITFFGADSIALSHFSYHEIKEIVDAYR